MTFAPTFSDIEEGTLPAASCAPAAGSTTCANVTGPAYGFAVGSNTRSASAPNANARAGHLNAFINQVNAKIGKGLTAEQAAILIGLVQNLY